MEQKKTSKSALLNKRNLLILLLLIISLGVAYLVVTNKAKVVPTSPIIEKAPKAVEEVAKPVAPPVEAKPVVRDGAVKPVVRQAEETTVASAEVAKPAAIKEVAKPLDIPLPTVSEAVEIADKNVEIEGEFEYESKDANNKNVIDAVPIPEEKIEKEEISERSEVFIIVDDMPEFPGGGIALRKWIAENLKYPENAIKNKIQGKVEVAFIVEKDGSIKNAKVSRGVETSLDQEALRIVKLFPKWQPGMQRGKPVRVSFTVPINFQLP